MKQDRSAVARLAAERKRKERSRMRAAGFVLRQLWVHPQDWDAVRTYVERKRKHRAADKSNERVK